MRAHIAIIIFFTFLVSGTCFTKPVLSQNRQAAANSRLKIMSYNIHHANPPSKAGLIDVDAIAEVIKKEHPDLVGLQEVDKGTKRSGNIDEAALIAQKTGMHYRFFKAIDYDSGYYGLAILSRFPIDTSGSIALPQVMKGEARILSFIGLRLPGTGPVIFANTHLDAQHADSNRVVQVKRIIDELDKKNEPVIIAGDFNSEAGKETIQLLDHSFRRSCIDGCPFTIPQVNPNKTIDYIATRNTGWPVVEHAVIPETYASDHRPVIAVYQLSQGAHARADGAAGAVYALIRRIVPVHSSRFEIAFIPKENDKDVFELESKNGKIILRGNNGISIASSLNYYLKNYAHCDISWNGTNLRFPQQLPVVPVKVRRTSLYKYRYYLNYCTFNYSMSWWDWKRWQWEIDWMALNGINLPLAITGQNAIWQRVYKSIGFTDDDLSQFFSGPAYFNWFYMGNLDAWGGPLPQSIITGQEALQKKILAQERAFGMTPVLPSFTGHVPSAFKTHYPNARLKKTHWSTFPEVYILDPNDPMFTRIGRRFLQEEIKTFGSDHFYTADTFNENTPPTNDSLYLNDISDKVYQAMMQADDKVVWIMQGWLFYHNEKFWQPRQVKALLNAVPDDRMMILDLWSENHPVWNRTHAYYGKPWIWCMLHNFGGNISLYGQMDVVATAPVKTFNDPAAGKMTGIGLTPEAIEQNPVMYELMLDNTWTDKPIDVSAWLKAYAWRRYGQKNRYADTAWDILHRTVYSGGVLNGGPESIITGRPTMAATTRGTHPKKNYAPADLLPAWDNLVKASASLTSEGFRYDLADITRQVLVNYADTLQRAFAAAYAKNDKEQFHLISSKFIELLTDVDQLLATRSDFLLGRWISDARKWGTSPGEKKLFERNARNLITLWGDEKSTLNEYSCRQWSGLINGFYKARWKQYFDYVNRQMRQNAPIDQKDFESRITHWEWQWVNGGEAYPDKPGGDAITMARKLYKKYHTEIRNTYQ